MNGQASPRLVAREIVAEIRRGQSEPLDVSATSRSWPTRPRTPTRGDADSCWGQGRIVRGMSHRGRQRSVSRSEDGASSVKRVDRLQTCLIRTALSQVLGVWDATLYSEHSYGRPGRLYSLPENKMRTRRRGQARQAADERPEDRKNGFSRSIEAALGFSHAAASVPAAGRERSAAPHLGQETAVARPKHGQSPWHPPGGSVRASTHPSRLRHSVALQLRSLLPPASIPHPPAMSCPPL